MKIIDFGSATTFSAKKLLTEKVGSTYYVAPEVLNGLYNSKCDIWSIGVITFILLSGFLPFGGDSEQEVFRSIQKGQYDFDKVAWRHISLEAKDFVM